ncbi:MAG: hypothetical protein ACP5I3_11135 [Thermoproteus sp.]
MYEPILRYVETGDPSYLERAAESALRTGAYLEHVLDLALLTPPESLPPSARRLLAGVKHVVETADCGSLPEYLKTPCWIAKRRAGWVGVEAERAPEVEALGVERVVYAFCKALGVAVQP